MKTYEAMFLVDAGNHEYEDAFAPVRDVLKRVEAEVLTIKPWDERRLAYKIKGRKRGLYVLTYFKADPARLGELQHDIQLNESVLRAMVLSADHVTAEQINADTPATAAEARRVNAEAERAAAAEKQADSDEKTSQKDRVEEPADVQKPAEQSAGPQDGSGQTESIKNNIETDADKPGGDIKDRDPDIQT